MSYFVIVRGPLGVGKTAVSKGLARKLGAEYISIDRILDDEGLWYSGRLSEFLRANDHVVRRARTFLRHGTPVIVDGNFYWKAQIEDLVRRLDGRAHIFTLEAPLRLCIQRDRGRAVPHGRAAAKAVYTKSTKFRYGIPWDATPPVRTVVRGIAARISES
jgi:predicted kinase